MTGAELRAWREANHYSQRDLALRLGYAHQYGWFWESGKLQIPDAVVRYVRSGKLPDERKQQSARYRRPRYHTPLCERHCRPCQVKRGWLNGRGPGIRPDAWTSEEDAWLRERACTATNADLARGLIAEFGRWRTPRAVRGRLQHLGLPQGSPDWTAEDVARVLGCGNDRVREWVAAGYLAAARERPMRKAQYLISPDALEACLRARPWLLDDRGAVRRRRYRDLLEAAWARDPWYTAAQAGGLARCGHGRIVAAIAAGTLPAERVGNGRYVIRRSALLAWQRAVEAAA